MIILIDIHDNCPRPETVAYYRLQADDIRKTFQQGTNGYTHALRIGEPNEIALQTVRLVVKITTRSSVGLGSLLCSYKALSH